ncbi:MAG: hypothetical protein LBG88_00140 [Christensenellaceae bacterium]|jgi:AraC-like DNA-binding protein|nr:hypothetical protein [Christensenellaceae bacterium]
MEQKMTPQQATAKTLLVIFPHIDRYCDTIAQSNISHAINSYGCDDTLGLVERIIEKTYKSQSMHNLKVKIATQIKTAPERIAKVIELHFEKGLRPIEVARELGISERTTFRLIGDTLQWFARRLDKCGINALTFRQLLANHGWVKNVYAKITEKT